MGIRVFGLVPLVHSTRSLILKTCVGTPPRRSSSVHGLNLAVLNSWTKAGARHIGPRGYRPASEATIVIGCACEGAFARENPPICSWPGCGVTLADKLMHADHVEPFKGLDDPKWLEISHLQWLCKPHHHRKTNEQRSLQRGRASSRERPTPRLPV